MGIMGLFCAKCGEKLEDGALFCTNCGTSVSGKKNNTSGTNAQGEYVTRFDPVTGFLDFQNGNVMASYGFLFSFILPILGLIFSCIGLAKAKEFNDQGKGISIAGICISSALILLGIILLIIFLVK